MPLPAALTGKKGGKSRLPAVNAFKASIIKIAEAGGMGVIDDFEEWKRSRALLKPDDQLDLSDLELKEEHIRVLTTRNPQQPDNLVQYDYRSGEFVKLPLPGDILVLHHETGTLLHKESEEAKRQMIEEGIDPATMVESVESLLEEVPQEATAIKEVSEEPKEDEDGDGEEGEGDEDEKHDDEKADGEGEGAGDEEEEELPTTTGKPKKLTNQFNFCERAALTYNLPTRIVETQTAPPPCANFSGQVLQWIIYDAYQQDYAEQQRQKDETERKPRAAKKKKKKKVQKTGFMSEKTQLRMFESMKVLERMINLNTFDDIGQDFRYWEDPSDEFREEEGTLLPLWKFTYEKAKKMMVTDICWNPWYYDLFAVTFGSLDFTKQITEGVLCLFTLKNPSYPEHICVLDSSVMCVDIHRKYPYFVVVGLYNGNVAVYNVQASCKEPQYVSNAVIDKHAGIVWEVKWGVDMQDGELNFFSVSGDGRVNNWILLQNNLSVTTVIPLIMAMDPVAGPDGTLVHMKGCASAIVFHPEDPLIFLVGTEEGLIYKCSTAYSSMYLLTYEAHDMPIYRIDFNKYNSEIFASCSGDWRIKIWEDNRLEPLFVFDLGSCVGDVKWAPYSSTVFAAVTNEGKVYVFDLNVNKYKSISSQAVVSRRRNKLTRLDFNWKLPIIIVGDDKGCVTTLKLSPNLRIKCKPPKKQLYLDQTTLQKMKLEKLLALVREPKKLEKPPDKAESDIS